MSQDLVMKLALENKELKDKLSLSANQIKKFKTETLQQSNGILKAFDGVISKAGGIGIALIGVKGANDVFKEIINSSQTLSDEFNNSIGAMNDTIKEFWYSLGSGDWSAFSNGIMGIYNTAKEAKEAMDQLGNAQISYDYLMADTNEQLAIQKEIIKNPNSTKNQKTDALAEYDRLLNEKQNKTDILLSDKQKALFLSIVSSTQLQQNEITLELIDSIISLDIMDDSTRSKEKNALADKYAEYESKLKQLKKEQRSVNTNGYTQSRLEYKVATDEKARNDLASQYKEAIVYNQLLVKWSDEDLQNSLKLVSSAKQLNTLLRLQKNERHEMARSVLKTDKPDKGKTDKTEKVKRETLKYNTAIQPNSDVFGNKNITALQLDLQTLQRLFNDATTDFERDALRNKIESLKKTIETLQNGKEGPKLGADIRGVVALNEMSVIPTISKDDRAGTLDYLTQVSGMMGALSGVSDKAGIAWLTYSANVIGGVASMLPALASVFGITAALGIAEQSKIPFPLNIIAMGASAVALAATIASLPKFANGGIVDGNSFYGDNMIARVNSGEMILNGSQQRNLFSILNNGGTTSQSNVTFRINGSDLIGTLNNYSKKTSKIR